MVYDPRLSEAQQVRASMTRSSFEDFYRTQFNPVLAFLIKFGAARAEAEDAVQSAMESLYRHCAEQRDPAAEIRDPAAWIRVVARNNWIRAIRRNATAVPTVTAGEGDEPLAAGYRGAEDPADVARRQAEQQDATRLLRTLPRTQREILALVFDGYKPAEIADIIGKKPAVVRSNLAHARRSLSQLFPERTATRRCAEAARRR